MHRNRSKNNKPILLRINHAYYFIIWYSRLKISSISTLYYPHSLHQLLIKKTFILCSTTSNLGWNNTAQECCTSRVLKTYLILFNFSPLPILPIRFSLPLSLPLSLFHLFYFECCWWIVFSVVSHHNKNFFK